MTQRQSYLLRLWKESNELTNSADSLRIVVVDPHTQKKRSFTTLIELVAWLEKKTDEMYQ